MDGCDIEPNICQTVCDDDCDPTCPDVQLEPAEMNPEKYEEMCIESRDKPDNGNPCRFWRFVSSFLVD